MRWIQDTKSIVTGNHRSGGILCDYFMKFSHIYEKCASGYRTHSGRTSQQNIPKCDYFNHPNSCLEPRCWGKLRSCILNLGSNFAFAPPVYCFLSVKQPVSVGSCSLGLRRGVQGAPHSTKPIPAGFGSVLCRHGVFIFTSAVAALLAPWLVVTAPAHAEAGTFTRTAITPNN